MVTTRLQTGEMADLTNDSFSALESLRQEVNSTSSKKRQSPNTADEWTPAPTRKRQKKLPLRRRDEQHFERHKHIAVEIPVKNITQDDTPMWTATKGKVDTERSLDKSVPDLEVQETGDEYAGGSEDGDNPSLAAQDVIDEQHIAPTQSEKSSNGPRQGKEIKSRPQPKPASSPKAVKTMSTSDIAKPKHKRFVSEEPVPEELEQRVEEGVEVEQENESSDNDAPEVVATHDAKEKVRISTRNATKAAEE